MLAAGLWSRRRKRKPHRSRRQRKAHFGELIQVDGSHHDWLEGRGSKGCMMNFVDDATGVALCRFSSEETTWAAADLLEAWVRQFGVPKALYCDWKNVYLRQPTSREAIEGIEPETQFGRMCAKLGIAIIAASSPQAKGRVERHHGTHQDRLIDATRRHCRLRGGEPISTSSICQSTTPSSPLSRRRERTSIGAYRSVWTTWVFCLEAERVVSNDRVVRFENRFLQLKPRNQALESVQAREGELQVVCAVAFEEIARPQPKPHPEPQQRAARQRQKPSAPPLASVATAEKTRGDDIKRKSYGNDGPDGKRGKPQRAAKRVRISTTGFPPFPPSLGNR